MANISGNPLVDTLLGSYDQAPERAFKAMVCTDFDPVTGNNTVTDGAVTYTNLGMLAPSLMSEGRILVAVTDGRPVILGPLHFPPLGP